MCHFAKSLTIFFVILNVLKKMPKIWWTQVVFLTNICVNDIKKYAKLSLSGNQYLQYLLLNDFDKVNE